jgi:hypothetical protein
VGGSSGPTAEASEGGGGSGQVGRR